MSPAAHITHRLTSRTRFKIPTKRGNQDYFDRITQRLDACSGVLSVAANARTGSLLIKHTAPLSEIIAFAEEHDLFTLGVDLKWRETWAQHTAVNLTQLNRRIMRLSGDNLDLRSVIVLTLLGLSLAQLFRGQLLPPASTLLWYAAQVLGLRGVLSDEKDRR